MLDRFHHPSSGAAGQALCHGKMNGEHGILKVRTPAWLWPIRLQERRTGPPRSGHSSHVREVFQAAQDAESLTCPVLCKIESISAQSMMNAAELSIRAGEAWTKEEHFPSRLAT